MDKGEVTLVVILAILLGCIFIGLGWNLAHSSSDYLKPCILAGYDTVKWDLFAPEPVCIKYTPFSQLEKP